MPYLLTFSGVSCGVIVNGHESRVNATNGERYGDWATYDCNAGYFYAYGDLYRTCLATREWSGIIPYCDGEKIIEN